MALHSIRRFKKILLNSKHHVSSAHTIVWIHQHVFPFQKELVKNMIGRTNAANPTSLGAHRWTTVHSSKTNVINFSWQDEPVFSLSSYNRLTLSSMFIYLCDYVQSSITPLSYVLRKESIALHWRDQYPENGIGIYKLVVLIHPQLSN